MMEGWVKMEIYLQSELSPLIKIMEFNINLEKSYMVGDRWRDMEAGRLAGCTTIFVDYDYDEQRPESFSFKVASLAEAAGLILSKGDLGDEN